MLPAPATLFEPEQVDAVRDCLRQITDDERGHLWGLLEPLMRAIAAGDLDTVVKLPGRTTGAVRNCLLLVRDALHGRVPPARSS